MKSLREGLWKGLSKTHKFQQARQMRWATLEWAGQAVHDHHGRTEVYPMLLHLRQPWPPGSKCAGIWQGSIQTAAGFWKGG